jgi:hypothetical protein
MVLTELVVRPADVGVPLGPPDTRQVRNVLTAGATLNLGALRTAISGAFRDEVRREVRKGRATPADAATTLPLVLREIAQRAGELHDASVLVKGLIPDLRLLLLPTATTPVVARAQRDLEERVGLDRVLALSSAVGALDALGQITSPTASVLQAHRAAAVSAEALQAVVGELLQEKHAARSRTEAARDVASLGRSASRLARLTEDARRAVGLLSLEYPTPGTVLEDIRTVSVEVGAATKATADQLLKMCAAEGFDAALKGLEYGHPVTLTRKLFTEATRIGEVASVTGDLTYKHG